MRDWKPVQREVAPVVYVQGHLNLQRSHLSSLGIQTLCSTGGGIWSWTNVVLTKICSFCTQRYMLIESKVVKMYCYKILLRPRIQKHLVARFRPDFAARKKFKIKKYSHSESDRQGQSQRRRATKIVDQMPCPVFCLHTVSSGGLVSLVMSHAVSFLRLRRGKSLHV